MKMLSVLFSLVLLLTAIVTAADTKAASKRVDELLAVSWQKQNLKPNPVVSDEVFLRRASLTVIGRIPTHEEAQAFLSCQAPDKREKLIDKLLSSEGYAQNFFNYWADVLRAQSQGVGGSTAAQNYLNYIRDSLRKNKPFDQMARELVSAEGTCFDNGAIGYYMRDRGMALDNLSNTIRIFLGTRLECAQCHNHPFDRWTQAEFYKMAAFTHNMNGGGYQSETMNAVNKLIREDKSLDDQTRDMMRRAINEVTTPLRDSRVVQGKSALRLPHDYKYTDMKPKDVVPAAVMFGKPVTLAKESNPVSEFSKWIASPENPRFTTVIANRLWKKVFGLGLIEPVDELMDDSAPSNPELMKFLSQQMIALKYDMKAYLRLLLLTQAFQRGSIKEDPQPGTPCYFQGPVFRRMSAEQIWDSMVTLINPDPDQANWMARERERRELENRKKLASLLDKTEPPLIIAACKQAATAMKEQNKQFDKLREELEQARAKNDKERSKDIQRRLGESQRIFRETVSRSFYEAAKKSGNQTIQAELAAASKSMGGPMEMAVMNMMESPRVETKDAPMDAEAMKQMDQEMVMLGIKDPKSRKSYENYRKGLHQSWCRASEMVSPAPRGHFLREFGQSDRDVIENASDEASVPQALTMMNASLMSQVSSGWSALSINLRKAANDSDKLDALYLSIFARKAAPKEKAWFLQMMDDRAASGAAIWEDIMLAALSTKQFLFIE